MLTDMYQPAVRAGIGADEYWDLTIREIIVQSEANRQRHLDALKERAVMDHKLSELIAFAMNEPNKMPSVEKMYGFTDEQQSAEPQEELPEWKKDQLEFMKQAERIRNTRNAKEGGE
ncbi:hypothetical protein [Levilactobacillus enshiensis]|uniref:hypothetical protein n=1 Tax=Levilactobacillus enshiensis TaxID=2590213 RepID=UPI001CDC75C1|nr:hypothetical protein [Levilactobacillus enshiensis]